MCFLFFFYFEIWPKSPIFSQSIIFSVPDQSGGGKMKMFGQIPYFYTTCNLENKQHYIIPALEFPIRGKCVPCENALLRSLLNK